MQFNLSDTCINQLNTDASSSTLLASCSDSSIRILNAETLDLVTTLTSHTAPVLNSIFIKDKIISICIKGDLKVWSCEGEYRVIKELSHPTSVSGMCGVVKDKVVICFVGMCDGRVVRHEFDANWNVVTVDVIMMKTGVVAMGCNEDLLVIADDCGVYEISTEKSIAVENNLIKNCINDDSMQEAKTSCVSNTNINLSNIISQNQNHAHSNNGYEILNFFVQTGVRDIAVAATNYFKINTYAFVDEEGLVIGQNRQRIDINGCWSVKWSMAGFCLCVGMENGSVKSYAPGSDGIFAEVEVDKIE